jgi:hypothetical protein
VHQLAILGDEGQLRDVGDRQRRSNTRRVEARYERDAEGGADAKGGGQVQ